MVRLLACLGLSLVVALAGAGAALAPWVAAKGSSNAAAASSTIDRARRGNREMFPRMAEPFPRQTRIVHRAIPEGTPDFGRYSRRLAANRALPVKRHVTSAD